jgi:hypothetical protein
MQHPLDGPVADGALERQQRVLVGGRLVAGHGGCAGRRRRGGLARARRVSRR